MASADNPRQETEAEARKRLGILSTPEELEIHERSVLERTRERITELEKLLEPRPIPEGIRGREVPDMIRAEMQLDQHTRDELKQLRAQEERCLQVLAGYEKRRRL